MEIPERFPLSSFLVALFRGNRASAAHQLGNCRHRQVDLRGQPRRQEVDLASGFLQRLFKLVMIPACLDVPTFAETLVDQSEPATPGHGISLSSDKRSALHASAFSDGGRRAVGAVLIGPGIWSFCAATFARKRIPTPGELLLWDLAFGALSFGVWDLELPSSSGGAPYSQRSTAVHQPGLGGTQRGVDALGIAGSTDFTDQIADLQRPLARKRSTACTSRAWLSRGRCTASSRMNACW